jgi:hypothetical protein
VTAVRKYHKKKLTEPNTKTETKNTEHQSGIPLPVSQDVRAMAGPGMPHNRRMMIATKKTKSNPQAKMADAVEAGARRSKEEVGLRTLEPPLPPPVPPPPSVVAMVPASARPETNRASVETKMMHATAGLGDASRRAMLVADMPADAAPADRAGMPSQEQALLDMTKDEAKIADAVDAGARRPSPRDDGLVRSLPQEATGRRTSDDAASIALPTSADEYARMLQDAYKRGAEAGARVAQRPTAGPTAKAVKAASSYRPTTDAPTPMADAGVLPTERLAAKDSRVEDVDPCDSPYPAPAAAPADDDYLGPPPSAPPLELLMEDELLDGTPPPACAPARGGTIPTGGRRRGAEPNPGRVPPRTSEAHRSREQMTPPAEAMVITMPVCEAVRMAGSGGEENDAPACWSVRCRKFAMIGLFLLGSVAVSTVIAVVVTMLALEGDDPVTTSTSSTAIVTGTTGTAISTGATGTGTMSTAITTSTSSTSSTTMPEMITVSE